jgi:hypothetical protein
VRTTVPFADRVERAGAGDVGRVVPGTLCEGSRLAPPRHTTDDEARIPVVEHVGTEPQSLEDAWAVGVEEDVRLFGQPQDRRHARRRLEVDGDPVLAAMECVERRVDRHLEGALRAIDAQHTRTLIGEEHPGERDGADPAQLDDPQSRQGPDAVRRGHQTSTSRDSSRTWRISRPGMRLAAMNSSFRSMP